MQLSARLFCLVHSLKKIFFVNGIKLLKLAPQLFFARLFHVFERYLLLLAHFHLQRDGVCTSLFER